MRKKYWKSSKKRILLERCRVSRKGRMSLESCQKLGTVGGGNHGRKCFGDGGN